MGTALPSLSGSVGICIVPVARDRKHLKSKIEDGGGMNEGTKVPRLFVRNRSNTAREWNVASKRAGQEGTSNGIMTV